MNKQNTDRIAYLLHKINSPLTALIGYNDLLKKSIGESEKQQTYLAGVETATFQIKEMIDELRSLL